jgi:3-methyladenine DNA glycosylase AlkD
MRIKVLKNLQSISEEKYKNFSLKLLPKDTNLIGVRIPLIKNLAKQLIKENTINKYLNEPLENLIYQEEKMLYSLLIAYSKIDKNEKLQYIKNYVAQIKNWSECDTFCAALKDVKQDQNFFFNNFYDYHKSKSEYEIRFFYVISLNYFINDKYLLSILDLIKNQKYVGFYDKMAVSWFLATAYNKYPKLIEDFLINENLDNFILKKSINKICDSYQVKKEAKIHLRKLASYK